MYLVKDIKLCRFKGSFIPCFICQRTSRGQKQEVNEIKYGESSKKKYYCTCDKKTHEKLGKVFDALEFRLLQVTKAVILLCNRV
jgi:hypothetical protein